MPTGSRTLPDDAVAVLRALWIASESSVPPTIQAFRVKNKDRRPIIDELIRREFIRPYGSHYRLALDGLYAVNLDPTREYIAMFNDALPALQTAYGRSDDGQVAMKDVVELIDHTHPMVENDLLIRALSYILPELPAGVLTASSGDAAGNLVSFRLGEAILDLDPLPLTKDVNEPRTADARPLLSPADRGLQDLLEDERAMLRFMFEEYVRQGRPGTSFSPRDDGQRLVFLRLRNKHLVEMQGTNQFLLTSAGIQDCESQKIASPSAPRTLASEQTPPVEQPKEGTAMPKDPRNVFVVHGRNEGARQAVFDLLRSVGLNPMEWEEARHLTRKASPYIGEILHAAFANAQAIVVLLTGDDEARLREELRGASEPAHEVNLMPQARPNVLFEAGMALGSNPDRTLLIEVGELRPFSDVAGRHTVRLQTGGAGERQSIVERLKSAGCAVVTEGRREWLERPFFRDVLGQARASSDVATDEPGLPPTIGPPPDEFPPDVKPKRKAITRLDQIETTDSVGRGVPKPRK